MKRVDTVARILWAFPAQGWSMRKITREVHVSCNTVRKILRSGETDFTWGVDKIWGSSSSLLPVLR